MTEYLYQPGRELDCAIAEEVLGLRVEWDFQQEDYAVLHKPTKTLKALPNFSGDTNSVFIVINHLQTHGYYNNVGSSSGGPIPIWRSSFSKKMTGSHAYTATGISLAHATCLAALNVVRDIKQIVKTTVPEQSLELAATANIVDTNIIQFPGRKK